MTIKLAISATAPARSAALHRFQSDLTSRITITLENLSAHRNLNLKKSMHCGGLTPSHRGTD